MSDHKSIEGEKHLVSAALHMVRALGAHKNLQDDCRKLLVDLDIKLSAMTLTSENKGDAGGLNDIENWMNSLEMKINSWVLDNTFALNCSLEEASEYFEVVEQVLGLSDNLASFPFNDDWKKKEFLRRSHTVLHSAMVQLEEEFSHILYKNRQFLETEKGNVSICLCEDVINEEDGAADEDDEEEESSASMEFIVNLVRPNAVPVLKCIANLMISSRYDQECSIAYVRNRRVALAEVLFRLDMERTSVEEVVKMDWPRLDLMIKKWIQSLKTFVRLYLASEKQLCDQVFEEFESAKLNCFVEISKSAVWQVLDFVEAVCIGSIQPEKLFRILDMYEVLTDLVPNIDALFSDEARYSFQMEYREAIHRLGSCAKRTFLKFENAVRWDPSANPFARGGIHHLSKYVMNYIKFVLEYEDTLNLLLREDEMTVASPSTMPPIREQDEDAPDSVSPLAHHLRIVISSLESNLRLKANLYKDKSLHHLFLMNNIHYMVQKIKGSNLRIVFGDPWLRRQIGKFQNQAREYKGATWGSILDLLKNEPGARSAASKKNLRERFRSFVLAFEEVYKSQTGWLIPDPLLREELRISVSGIVVQAYRSFVERHYNQLEAGSYFGKRIKYSSDDLGNYLLELFEGSPRSLQ